MSGMGNLARMAEQAKGLGDVGVSRVGELLFSTAAVLSMATLVVAVEPEPRRLRPVTVQVSVPPGMIGPSV